MAHNRKPVQPGSGWANHNGHVSNGSQPKAAIRILGDGEEKPADRKSFDRSRREAAALVVAIVGGKFDAGLLVKTPGVDRDVPVEEWQVCLLRHVNGDWGDMGETDWQTNDAALQHGGRLFSRYHTKSGIVFYIITDVIRLYTTILLASDY